MTEQGNAMKTVTIRNLPADVHQAILAAAARRPLAAPADHAATFGLWKNRKVDALDYQRRVREEW